MKARFVPIQVWGIAFFLVAITFVITYKLHTNKKQAGDPLYQSYIKEFNENLALLIKSQGNSPNESIVFLGSSFMGHALDNDFLMESLASEGPEIKIHKIWHPGFQNFELENEDLFNQIERLNPKLILIENQIFFYQNRANFLKRTGNNKKFRFAQVLKYYRMTINAFVLKGLNFFSTKKKKKKNKSTASTRFGYIEHRLQSTISHQDSIDYIRLSNKKQARLILRDFEHNPMHNQILSAFKDKGGEVIILPVPKPGKVEEIFYTKEKLEKINALKAEYEKKLGLEFWNYERRLPFDHYTDIVHMNNKGRAAYSKWLLSMLSTKLQ